MTYIIALILWLAVVMWVTRDIRGTRKPKAHRFYDWEVHGL